MPVEQPPDAVLRSLEELILTLLDTGGLQLTLRTWANVAVRDDGVLVLAAGNRKQCSVGWRRLACVMRVVEHVFKLKQAGRHATKRDIYYMDTDLFGSQGAADRGVDDLACTVRATRHLLNVGATSKGLVAGRLTYRVALSGAAAAGEGRRIDVSASPRGQAITSEGAPYAFETPAAFVLVVEKDSTLMRLVDDGAAEGLNCLIVTGRGYPCVATREFLRRLWCETGLPVRVLTDADPHGAQIALTYALGSLSLCHENEHLALPELEWVGLTLEDCGRHALPPSTLLACTADDLRKAKALMSHPSLVADGASLASPKLPAAKRRRVAAGAGAGSGGGGRLAQGAEWARRVASFVEKGKKAEIQALQSRGLTYLADVFLPEVLGLPRSAGAGTATVGRASHVSAGACS
eukprot:Rhum_TRINITY_DN25756_c0_g1::Rhum_TRINITY_DN25756_c0_g1_i1::g.182719::m.182719/K10878/SPO11; meiotic recombination protein SPO11